ncbi:MAG: hypothetical protein LLG04_01155 [Parachlamydia sp.]|nr:hypothetical protein [Parachlamydia sp.]
MSLDSSINFYFAQNYGAQAPWVQASYETNRKREAIERRALANVDPATLIKLGTSKHAPLDSKKENSSVRQGTSITLKPAKNIQKSCATRFKNPLMQKIHREFVARRQANQALPKDPTKH